MEICDEVTYPSILKLADSMNSQGVVRVDDKHQYDSAMAHLFSLFLVDKSTQFSQNRNIYAYGKSGQKVLIQPFCPGGGHTTVACKQLTGINTYVALADLLMGAPLPTPVFDDNKAILYGGILYQTSGILRRVCGMQVVEQQPGLIELVTLGNPRGYSIDHATISTTPLCLFYLQW
jgi:hypothetical protein